MDLRYRLLLSSISPPSSSSSPLALFPKVRPFEDLRESPQDMNACKAECVALPACVAVTFSKNAGTKFHESVKAGLVSKPGQG